MVGAVILKKGRDHLADFEVPSRVGIKSFHLKHYKKKEENVVTSLTDFERKLRFV
ncbi:MAG: hypothetical protein M1594_01350 [Candidatus Marsarchaeota archaeon]|nr:hypothetical protein [Candidatus Marsarchaeota archaeon]